MTEAQYQFDLNKSGHIAGHVDAVRRINNVEEKRKSGTVGIYHYVFQIEKLLKNKPEHQEEDAPWE